MAAELDDMHLLDALEPGEEVRAKAAATDAVLAVTDRRVVVAAPARVALAVPIVGVRRIQFDIEQRRPATLVIVPEEPENEAQVLTIPADQYEAAGRALVILGQDLAKLSQDRRRPARA
jgi:hypothetical protein